MKQSEIWLINLDPTIGAEIKKTRPAIIVNDNSLGKLPLKIIVPLTDWKERYEIAPWMVYIKPDSINNLTKVSGADCFQIRSIAEERFIRKIGKISSGNLEDIKEALSKVLAIETY
ncbi:type II toxin-antitoxin system PemK/MazF family toxin [Perlabentimonas gracilis]|uniref:type II toxin-antitoxin system PemK/MazF family toxin n=1 Tax=Perlabentimonas gracilis TaxID=2715279 RepID=UPI00140E1F09|nr:type II toxin-antitoxin system PemK/MazF family toxin [Perlabentimonas gracilis]NHB68588.1 type II toxin-antitoxin system PemK/MazF family toxin [Perlabentimonas gracilis]